MQLLKLIHLINKINTIVKLDGHQIHTVDECPQQNNSVDYSVYVINFVQFLFDKNNLIFKKSSSLKRLELNKLMAEEIQYNQIDYKNNNKDIAIDLIDFTISKKRIKVAGTKFNQL